jgi:RHS repeat-associated protein
LHIPRRTEPDAQRQRSNRYASYQSGLSAGQVPEGEFVPGSPGTAYHYGVDQIGSVRRAFIDSSMAPEYEFDPYGAALLPTARVTDFGYAGMFFHHASGLYLTQYRAYDPVAGRWLSRDRLFDPPPAGWFVDQRDITNLYTYVRGAPSIYTDPRGTNPLIGVGAAAGTAAMPGPGTVAGAIIGGALGYVVGGIVADQIFSSEVPPLPEDLTGENPRQGSGNRINTDLPGELLDDVVDALTGGVTSEGERGSRSCPNGVLIRPGKPGEGPRIDIPASGDRPHETIHFPPGTPWPW